VADLDAIYKQHFQDVYLFVLSLSRNEQIAEEITQETFFKAIKNMEQFKGTCKLSVWLCQIAKNSYFSYLNSQKRFVHDERQEEASGFDMEKSFADKAEALRIHKLVHSLEDPYKEVFMLRVFGELPFSHISQIFEKTESWARVTYHRARNKIQDLLMGEER